MIDETKIIEVLKKIIYDITSNKYENLDVNKELVYFGIDGDDAFDFIDKIEEIFKVDFSEYDHRKYFYSEGSIFSIRAWLEEKKIPLTLIDIIDAINKGKWIEKDKRIN